jgi:hypothetical protein
MATATNLGPIGINQINNVFYVGGDGGFPTIQAAVDYVQKYNAGVGHVTIVHGYSGSETISSIVRGSPNTYITDQRNTAIQNYAWTPALGQFSPADFLQLANARVGGEMKVYGFAATDLTASHVSVGTGGLDPTLPVITLVNAAAPADQKQWLIGVNPTTLFFSATADSGQDTSWMRVTRSGGAANKVTIVPPMDVTGVLTSQGSPVRTFANSPDSGGGGTGGVNPGSTGQLSFYEVDGPLLSPAAITTDVATQSSLTVPTIVQSAQTMTNTTNFADGNPSNWFYLQEQTFSTTAGGGINVGGPWSVTVNGTDTMYHSQRGIAQIRGGAMERHGIGDTAAVYYYINADGGAAAGSDEGVSGMNVHVLENSTYFHGTVNATTGIGDQAPVYTATSGQQRTTDGAFMLNISKGQLYGFWNGASATTYMDTGSGAIATYLNQLPITGLLLANVPGWSTSKKYAAGNIVVSAGTDYVSLVPNNLGHPPATSSAQWRVLPNGQVPISTAIGMATTGIPYNNGPANQPASRTFVVNLVKIGGTFPTFAATDVVTVAGDYGAPEQSIIATAPPPTSGSTQQTLTMKLRNANGNAIIFKGGIQGQYISHDANLAFSGMRSSYYALGSLTGSEVIYGHNVVGSLVGRLLPNTGAEAATSSGPNAGFHLYPGAEITSNTNFGYAPTLEQNGVRWEIGDAVENPHYPEFGGVGILLNKLQITPTSPAFGTSGLSILLGGKGFCGSAAQALAIRSNEPSTNFFGDGGPTAPPGGISLMGYYSYGLTMSAAPTGYCLSVESPAAPNNNPGADVNLIQIHYSTGGSLIYSVSTNTWKYTGSISAANLTLGGTLAVNPLGGIAASFYNGRTTIDSTNDYVEFVFNKDDGSGNGIAQRIKADNNIDYNMNYETFNDGGHIFTTTNYGNATRTTLATLSYDGLTVKGAHSAVGMNLTAIGADTFGFTLWATGNSAGLSGVFGLYDITRGGFVWNTNPAGDVFFSTPISGGNVTAGVGATAKITAAGLIDATAFSVAGVAGASGTYTTADAHTVTVTHGLITAIV